MVSGADLNTREAHGRLPCLSRLCTPREAIRRLVQAGANRREIEITGERPLGLRDHRRRSPVSVQTQSAFGTRSLRRSLDGVRHSVPKTDQQADEC